MVYLIRYAALVLLCGSLAAQADDPDRGQMSPALSSLQSPDVVTQFLGRVDAVIQMLNSDEVDVFQAMAVAQELEARSGLELVKEAHGNAGVDNYVAKSQAARKLLSQVRYLALENACVGQLNSSNEVTRILSTRVLTQSLGSSAGKRQMEAVLIKGLKSLDENGVMSVSPNELFSVAEGLAYLGNSSGVDVFESVLRADGSPSFLKRRAIKALTYLGHPVTSGEMADMLLSDDAAVAYTAFDSAETQSTNRIVISAAITQIQKLKTTYSTVNELSYNEIALLGKAAFILKMASREDALSGHERENAKQAIVYFADVHDTRIQEKIASLFAELATEEDSVLISRLLKSESQWVRSYAALALAQCSKTTIHAHKEELIGLLDDNSANVRNFALYALRVGLGEKAGTYLSEAEYKTQKERVLNNYSK